MTCDRWRIYHKTLDGVFIGRTSKTLSKLMDKHFDNLLKLIIWASQSVRLQDTSKLINILTHKPINLIRLKHRNE